MLFFSSDLPNAKGGLFKKLSKVKPYDSKIIKIIPQIKDKAHLQKFLKEIEAKGGESVVVRDPNVAYIDTRTNKALSVKSFKDDECIVIGHGKYTNLLGSITCKMNNNITFKKALKYDI